MPRVKSLIQSALVAGLVLSIVPVIAMDARAESNRRVCFKLFAQNLPNQDPDVPVKVAKVAIWGKTSISDEEACGNIMNQIDRDKDGLLRDHKQTNPAGYESQIDPGQWQLIAAEHNRTCETLDEWFQLGGDPCFDAEVSPGPADQVHLFVTPIYVADEGQPLICDLKRKRSGKKKDRGEEEEQEQQGNDC